MHEDVSVMLEQDGVKVSFIAVPEYKTEASPYEPLSEEAKEFHMGQVQATYEEFVKDVSRGRGTPVSKIKADSGKGRTFHATEATERGMVDGVQTMPQLLQRLGLGGKAQLTTAQQQDVTEMLCAAWVNELPVEMNVGPDVSVRKARLFLLTPDGRVVDY
jgi:ClpP class serine protease